MTRVVFETATLADVLKKAARVAPSKGAAFDKASGVVLEITPMSDVSVVIKATNLDIYYTEWVDCVEADGPDAVWRLPSMLLAQAIGSLPIGSGKTVQFEQKDQHVKVTSGRTRAQINLIDPTYYPDWRPFDPDDLTPVADMGGRLAMVEWAAAKDRSIPVLNGVNFDGEIAAATDRMRCATVPLVIPDLPHPITVPAGLLTPLLKQTGEVLFGFEGTQVKLMPDDHTQVRISVLGDEFPNIRGMKRDHSQCVTFSKSRLIEMITRANTFAGSDRFPTLRTFFGKEEVAVMMAHQDVGFLGDILDVPGQAVHERVEIKFNPTFLTDALEAAPSEEVSLYYETQGVTAVRIDGGSGFEAWVMPRRDISQQGG